MHAELPETYAKITFTTNSTFGKMVLVLKNMENFLVANINSSKMNQMFSHLIFTRFL